MPHLHTSPLPTSFPRKRESTFRTVMYCRRPRRYGVIPAQAGIQSYTTSLLDPGLRRDDARKNR